MARTTAQHSADRKCRNIQPPRRMRSPTSMYRAVFCATDALESGIRSLYGALLFAVQMGHLRGRIALAGRRALGSGPLDPAQLRRVEDERPRSQSLLQLIASARPDQGHDVMALR